MSHPSLGLPPRNMRAGFPDAAGRVRAARDRLAARALEIALQRDPTLGRRFDELALRHLLRDAGSLLDRVAGAVASDDPAVLAQFADWSAPAYRRRRVPMDDLVNLCEGIRQALLSVLAPDERAAADRALDAAVRTFRSYRRLSGDARRRNPILWAIYKGA